MKLIDQLLWKDAKPIAPIMICIVIVQLAGIAFCALESITPIYIGGALATPAGYLLGVVVQAFIRPEALVENRTLVIRMAFIAIFIGIVAWQMFEK